MRYKDHFTRLQDAQGFNKTFYTRNIRSRVKDTKELNLFKDCFSNHTEFVAPSTKKLVLNKKDAKDRYIQKDNLSAYFVNEIYSPPKLYELGADTGEDLNYQNFLDDFADSSFYEEQRDSRFSLGTNRIKYVVGDVGQGKSAFMKRVYCDLDRQQNTLDKNYRVVSVYVDLEQEFHYTEEPKPLTDHFEVYLFRQIAARLNDKNTGFNFGNITEINPHNDPTLSLKLLVSKAKEQKIRFLIYIDNLDFYHYYYARYSFFEKGNKKQEESVIDNIMWLRSVLSSSESLGHLGLNILIASRSYVYDEIISHTSGVETEVDTTQAIYLADSSESVVVDSRLDLFSRALSIIQKDTPGASGGLNNLLNAFKASLKIGSNNESETPLGTIYKLGQHGHRSLVHFISSMNLSAPDRELIDRFFSRQISSLYTLYFNNMCQRYTQQNDHFPNIFLVDCMVMKSDSFPPAHQPHMHSYWLKYFILKYIYNNRQTGVSLSDLLDIFCQNGYEEHLVRHVIGSLCTANEFRCAELDSSQVERPFSSRKIYPTERGKMLFREVEDSELCFEFEYIGTIVDDKWLSIPNKYLAGIYYPEKNYAHLYEPGSQYIKSSLSSVRYQSIQSINFLRVLKAAFEIEIKKLKPELHKLLKEQGLVPDFEKIQKQLISSARSLIISLGKDPEAKEIEDLKRLVDDINNDDSYEAFFLEYFDSKTLVES